MKTNPELLAQHIRGRIEVVEALNDLLAANTGWFGFISWWKINKFVKDQLKENQRLLNEHWEAVRANMR